MKRLFGDKRAKRQQEQADDAEADKAAAERLKRVKKGSDAELEK